MVIRQLTKVEQERAQEAESYRTQYEKKAYHYLPDCMKKRVKRNVVVAFKNSPRAYFPDLFFENEGVCLEIDGNSHKNRILKDARRDRIFESNAFTTIRIKNEDLVVDVVFWQLLVAGLRKIENPVDNVLLFIRELDEMIDEGIKSWTQIEDYE